MEYVLGHFGRTVRGGREANVGYVEAGLEQGRRDELAGGGSIHLLGVYISICHRSLIPLNRYPQLLTR